MDNANQLAKHRVLLSVEFYCQGQVSNYFDVDILLL